MKILQLSVPLHSEKGGRSVLVKELGLELSRLGHDVLWAHEEVLTQGEGVSESSDHLRIPIKELGPGSDQHALSEFVESLRSFMDNHRPDIIHCHRIGAIEALVLSKVVVARGIPVIYTEHEAPIRGEQEFFLKRKDLFARFDRVILPSRASHLMNCRLFPDIANKLVSISNGLSSLPSRTSAVRPMTAFFSGRHNNEKGLRWLLEAWLQVVDSVPEAVLTVAGEGPETEELTRWGLDHGLAENIQWLGWLGHEESRVLAATHQIVIVPSLWEEPFGLAALEASAGGRPAIVSAVGALPEIVEHERTGLHVEPGDTEGLTSAISALLENPALCDVYGKAGQEAFEERFTIRDCARAHVALYDQLIQESIGVSS